jgi:hypothetical protein
MGKAKGADGFCSSGTMRRKFGLGVMVLVVAAVALPIAMRSRGAAKARQMQQSLMRQLGEIAELEAENARLSNGLSSKAMKSEEEETRELLRLRSEVGLLRNETQRIDRLRQEIERQPAGAAAASETRNSELSAQTLQAMQQICRALPSAMERFMAEHKEMPNNLSALRRYFPLVDGRRMAGLYTFDFVRQDGPKPEDLLILGETGARETPDGKRARVYGYRDGSAVEIRRDDDDFEEWEKEHFISPP